MRTLLVFALSVSLALSGCASGSGSSRYNAQADGLTNDQRVVRANADRVDPEQHEQDTTGEGILLGALLLGAVGCGIALAAGGDGGSCAMAGAAGAVVGAGAGYAAGSWVAGKQTSYASKEDYYREVIAAADTEIVENRKAANAANRLADQYAATIQQLNADYVAKKTTAKAYRQQYEEMETDARAISYTIEQNRQRIDELDRVISQADYGDPAGQSLKQRRDQLAQENASLEAAYNQMVAALATAPPEVQS